MSDRFFHSPYQFLPVTGRLNGADPADDRPVPITDYDTLAGGDDLAIPARHDRWQADCLSGRLICRLDTVSPVLVGAEQEREYGRLGKVIRPYLRDGRPALPASSLRGMVGSLAEALSQSALRILSDTRYAVRTEMPGLQAIGALRYQDGQWSLLPLALTAIHKPQRKSDDETNPFSRWMTVFGTASSVEDCVARYFHNYWYPGTQRPPSQIRQLGALRCSRFDDDKPPQYVWVERVAGLRPHHRNPAILFRHTVDVLPDQSAFAAAEPDNGSHERGLLYIMGHHGHDLMPNKRHEWFVPVAANISERPPLEVPASVIDEFEELAAERSQATARDNQEMPLLPVGYKEGRVPRTPDGKGGLLRPGDLIYFDVDEAGKTVTRLSYSALWRRQARDSTHEAFIKSAGPDTVPWNPSRSALTPGEALFGVVEDIDRNQSIKGRDGRGLASRIAFADGIPLGTDQNLLQAELIPLKIGANPKPPSPGMYYRQAGGGPVRRCELPSRAPSDSSEADPFSPRPNGRKVYLNYPADQLQHEPWRTGRLHSAEALSAAGESKEAEQIKDAYDRQGSWGQPIAAGQSFWFHVDFENLSCAELGLLCTALMPAMNPLGLRPKECFLHKLGWGKPLGLGSVAVTIVGLYTHDRLARYTSADALSPEAPSLACRYRVEDEDPAHEAALRARYPRERPRVPDPALAFAPADLPGELLDREALLALLAVGDPARVKHPVGYPFSARARPRQDAGNEKEGFKWFTGNTQAHPAQYQHLPPPPLDQSSSLPHLVAHHGELRLNLGAANGPLGLEQAADDQEAKQRIRRHFRAYGTIIVKGRDLTGGTGFVTLLLAPEAAERVLTDHSDLVELARERD